MCQLFPPKGKKFSLLRGTPESRMSPKVQANSGEAPFHMQGTGLDSAIC